MIKTGNYISNWQKYLLDQFIDLKIEFWKNKSNQLDDMIYKIVDDLNE